MGALGIQDFLSVNGIKTIMYVFIHSRQKKSLIWFNIESFLTMITDRHGWTQQIWLT